MSSKTLCGLVRVAVIAVAVCGLAVCGFILPTLGTDIAKGNPEYTNAYLPWLIFLWVAFAPCYTILVLVWKVSTAIGLEQVFSLRTARHVQLAAILLFLDVGYFFVGNVTLLLLNMSHPGVVLLSLLADVFGVSMAVLAAILSRYLTKAAVLQEEVDGTI